MGQPNTLPSKTRLIPPQTGLPGAGDGKKAGCSEKLARFQLKYLTYYERPREGKN